MSKPILSSVVLVACVSLAGCDKKPPPPPTTTTTTTSATASASAATTASAAVSASAAAGDSGAAIAYMAHCPTAVKGAKTEIKDVAGGVQLTVTAADEAGTKDVRDRTKALLEAAKTTDTTHLHTGGGGGKGRFGHCAIVMHNTTLESAEVPNGVKVTVKPKSKDELDFLRRETRDRDANAKAPGGSGMGAHKMAHCPSAVDGATTKVENTKDGVTVTVTAKGDQVKEIRERGKHVIEVSKMSDPSSPEHTSEGKGGGGLGRCPVLVTGDTTVEMKEVEGGAAFTVKAKTAGEAPGIQKEAKERALAFTGK